MKKNRNKMWLVRMMAAVMVLTLAVGMLTGCGEKVMDKDEQGRTMISVNAWPTKEGVKKDNAEAKKARFEADNPDVVIIPNAWTFDRKTFYAKAAGGQLPTVYAAGFTEVPEIIAAGYSADLTNVLHKRGYDGMIQENILKLLSDEEGRVKAMPQAAYILGLACNIEMMEVAGLMEADGTPKQPKDWYELAEFAVKIKEATGKPGFILPTTTNKGGWIFNPIAWSFGVDFMEKDADGKWKATFNTPEAVAALQYIKDLRWKYDVLPKNTLIDGSEYYKALATGNAGMMLAAGDIPSSVVTYDMSADNLGMMAMPAGPKRHVTLLGGGIECVAAGSTEDQIDAAIRWMEIGINHKATDDFKANKERKIQEKLAAGQLVGIKEMSIWTESSEALQWEHALIDKNANVNLNHVKLYNDFVADCPAEIQPEEPVCCQELYGILDSCIQEVLSSKDADCAKLIEKAASDFQSNYLDNI